MAVLLSSCGSSPPATEAPPDSPADRPSEGATPTAPAAAGASRIAFTRWTPPADAPVLWTATIDGEDAAPVGHQAAFFPDWSPDRTLIVFGAPDGDGNDQVATIRPDGSDLSILTVGAGFNEAPDYSPDGDTIVYAHSDLHEGEPGFATALWMMAADGSDQRPLPLADGGGDDTEPEFSPDGSLIVFIRYRHDPADTRAVHVAAADGSDVRRVTPWRHAVEHPRWSPDGATIIYNVENNEDAPSNEGEGIWTVPTAGGRPTLLLASTDELHGYKPDFSPDGTQVVFGCATDGRTSEDICVMGADGQHVRRVVTGPAYENQVVWR